MSPRSRYLFLSFSLVSAALCVRLGFWQVHRLQARRAANAEAMTSRSRPPLDLSSDWRQPEADRRVSVSGEYDHAHEVVVRSQSFEGSPGVRILTPLRMAGQDTAVLVVRGFVPSPDATTLPPGDRSEPGVRKVVGIAYPIPSEGGGDPITHAGATTWRRLDLPEIRRRIPYPIAGFFVLQLPDSAQPAGMRRLEAPELDDGPHLSYAVQWFSFALVAFVGGLILTFRSRPGS